jgi:hypothetical protein
MVAGRTTDQRSVTVTTTNASTAVTAAAGTFDTSDVGRKITATGIPANATLSAVASDTAATLSAAATATGSRSATVGGLTDGSLGFTGWSPETGTESASYTVAANNAGTVPPDRVANPTTGRAEGRRSRS